MYGILVTTDRSSHVLCYVNVMAVSCVGLMYESQTQSRCSS